MRRSLGPFRFVVAALARRVRPCALADRRLRVILHLRARLPARRGPLRLRLGRDDRRLFLLALRWRRPQMLRLVGLAQPQLRLPERRRVREEPDRLRLHPSLASPSSLGQPTPRLEAETITIPPPARTS